MRKDKGIALILAIIVVTMVSLLLTSYVAITISERKRVEHESAAASAEYIARAGLEKAFFDLSCEYEKDRDWINDDTINGRIINDDGNGTLEAGEGMPAFNLGAQTEAPNERSNYQRFYINVGFPDAVAPIGNYTVDIAFVNNAADTAFLSNRLWVRSTGIATATGDTVTLAQLARVKRVALVETDAGTGDLVEIERLYDYVDDPSGSAVDDAATAGANHEIRISGSTLDQDVAVDKSVTIKGGYGFDFTDGSRDTSKNVSTLTDSGLAPMVTLSGSGTVTMGGVRIE